MSSFLELQKRARYLELCQRMAPVLARDWTWPDVVALLQALGVTDPYGFFASGWWLPVAAVEDPAELERLAGLLERAMAEGRFPSPEQGYGWDDLTRLEPVCGIRPADVVRRLVWNYALTLGEEAMVATLERAAAPAPLRPPDPPADPPAAG